MLNAMQNGTANQIAGFSAEAVLCANQRREVFESNRHRVYAIAFWMTGNELAAEDLMTDVFRSAFLVNPTPTVEDVDRALVGELRKTFHIPVFTLSCAPATQVRNVRRNTLRTELEAAVLQLPATEKLIFLMHDVERFEHEYIARLLGITDRESRLALHQGRLYLRELLAK